MIVFESPTILSLVKINLRFNIL